MSQRQTDVMNCVPPPSKAVLGIASWMIKRRVRSSFHALRLYSENVPVLNTQESAIVYCNHASWWDPLTCLILSRELWPGRDHYGPIDAEALERYAVLRRLGFFPVPGATAKGARVFLRTGTALLAQPRATLWITPQGRFADVRERPVTFQRGLGALAANNATVTLVPLAIEYPFWNESKPEILAAFGKPVILSQGDAREAGGKLENALYQLQNSLAKVVLSRSPEPFQTLVGGKVGVGGIYDSWKSLCAFLRGRRHDSSHGSISRSRNHEHA